MSELYDRIRELCYKRGITPSKMCVDLGWSKSIMSGLKTGRVKTLSSARVSAIAQYLNVSTDVVLGTSEPTDPTVRDITDEFERFKASLSGDTVLFHDGEPLSEESKQSIINALDVIMDLAIARAENDKEKPNSKTEEKV